MGNITMSRKERKQLIVFNELKKRVITQIEAASRLSLSTRWVRAKYKRYLQQGDAGLVHTNRGKPNGRKWDGPERTMAINLLKSDDWDGFGPTFAVKKLKQLHGIHINKETLRGAMLEEGLCGAWRRKNRRLKHRKRRERKEQLGQLVQLDGSPHDWFEGRAPWCTLLVFIDDATSRILWLQFATSESMLEVMRATKAYVQQYGAPHEFYVDYGRVFSVNLNNPERDKKTQWERAVCSIGSGVIHARSPQAKGRVERANGTLQDHLPKELRLAGISSIEDANRFLAESTFIQDHNQAYAVEPAMHGNVHKTVLDEDLNDALLIKEERVLTNDYTVTYKRRIFQLIVRQPAIIRPKQKVTINTHLDGSISLSVRRTNLLFKELLSLPIRIENEKVVKPYKSRKPSENSRRWVSGILPRGAQESALGRVG